MTFLGQLFSPASSAANEDWTSTDPWLRFGNRTVMFMAGGLFLFALIVSISGAVIATGKVTVEGNYRSVQHAEGGIVKAIHVKNGDLVEKGQQLISLDATEARANLEIVTSRIAELAMQEARLIAESEGRETFLMPEGLADKPDIARVHAAQTQLFNARMSAFRGEQDVLGERLSQSENELTGLNAQVAARSRENALIEQELEEILPLYDKGYVNRARVTPLKREAARLAGELGRLEAQRAKVESLVSETRLAKAQSRKQFLKETLDELSKVKAQLKEQREAYKKFADTAARIEIRAPHAGRVHALAVHTIGGVVTPASQIALIVPVDEPLVIEARLSPTDIDRVRPGQSADVMFPSFNARTTPKLAGHVRRVSPAEETDEQGRTYFTAQIGIAGEELARIDAAHPLVPGMPAEVFIETNARSILSYLLRPLTDTLAHTFRER